MARTLVEEFVADPQNMRMFQQERAIYEITELIESVMEKQGISRSALAIRLGKTKGWVTQLLDGETNKTIRTVADVLAVLGHEFRTFASPIEISNAPRFAADFTGNAEWQQSWPYHLRLADEAA